MYDKNDKFKYELDEIIQIYRAYVQNFVISDKDDFSTQALIAQTRKIFIKFDYFRLIEISHCNFCDKNYHIFDQCREKHFHLKVAYKKFLVDKVKNKSNDNYKKRKRDNDDNNDFNNKKFNKKFKFDNKSKNKENKEK